MSTILIVDSERASREPVVRQLRGEGYRVREAQDCQTADRLLGEHCPELLMLDWTLPDMAGLEYVERLRRREGLRPPRVIMVSRRYDVRNVVRALDSGIDDFIARPYRAAELLARVRATLRRPPILPVKRLLQVGAVAMDRIAHRVQINGQETSLAPAEYRLLEFLLAHPGRVHSRAQLLARVWGREHGVSPRTVDVHVRRLRQVLEPHALEGMIETIRGFGYRLQVNAETVANAG
ncbi:MAG: winged helix-turn-helix domain-containing protein [Gammaproteobacteria bacterium]|nr:winged helix-turn-helix domain-containing protein [Gammaproteobacteria bacterium]